MPFIARLYYYQKKKTLSASELSAEELSLDQAQLVKRKSADTLYANEQVQTLLKNPSRVILRGFEIRCWHRVIFPGGGPPSIFTEVSLYDRVRDGNGWFPYSLTPANSFIR